MDGPVRFKFRNLHAPSLRCLQVFHICTARSRRRRGRGARQRSIAARLRIFVEDPRSQEAKINFCNQKQVGASLSTQIIWQYGNSNYKCGGRRSNGAITHNSNEKPSPDLCQGQRRKEVGDDDEFPWLMVILFLLTLGAIADHG